MADGDMYEQMRAAVQRVAKARRDHETIALVLKGDREDFDKAHADLLASVKRTAAMVEEAEAIAKALVEAHYAATKEKKPVAGVQVKERTTYAITDDAAALAWAQASQLALVPESVDTKALLKIASVTPLPFVAATVTPQAQLDSAIPVDA